MIITVACSTRHSERRFDTVQRRQGASWPKATVFRLSAILHTLMKILITNEVPFEAWHRNKRHLGSSKACPDNKRTYTNK